MKRLSQSNLSLWRSGYLNARRSLWFSNAKEYRHRLKRMGVLELPCTARILDFGSGDGMMIQILHSLGFSNVVGPDRLLFEPGCSDSLVIGQGPDIPFADHTFDAVISNAVLHHLSDKKIITSTLTEFRRILRPGGLLAYHEPSNTLIRSVMTWLLLGSVGRISKFSRQKRLMVLSEWETLSGWLEIERDFPHQFLQPAGFNVQFVSRGPLKTTVRAVTADSGPIARS